MEWPKGKTLRASVPTGCKGFTEEMGWLLEDGWDFHTWRWVGKCGFRESVQNIGV